MMRRLCWVVVVVFVLLTSMVGMAIFTGHDQSPAAALQRFHLDDCLSPRVLCITLCKTTYNEALALFRQRQNGPGAIAVEQIAPEVITLRMMDNDKRFVANEITVSFIGGVVNSVKIAGVYGPGNGVIPT